MLTVFEIPSFVEAVSQRVKLLENLMTDLPTLRADIASLKADIETLIAALKVGPVDLQPAADDIASLKTAIEAALPPTLAVKP
jgi:hypothetical protein